MYKVHPKDVIPTRTTEEAFELGNKPFSVSKAYHEKLEKTWNALGKHFHRGQSVNAIMRTAYRFADLAMQPFAERSVCVKGCSHCCILDVSVTLLEAAYIENNTKHKIINGGKVRRAERNTEYCPFHDEKTSSCSIYFFRPLACRWFFTMDDPAHCEDPKKSHAISASNGTPTNPHLKSLFSYVEESSNGDRRDIRQFFNKVE